MKLRHASLLRLALLASVAVAAPLAVACVAMAQPMPGDPPPHLTTPTADYCAHLNREVGRQQGSGAPQPSARSLAEEGARMCDRGQYRGGVVRLRRALILMRAPR